MSFAIHVGCLELVGYVFFYWLPFYMNDAHGWLEKDADRISVWFDVGGIFGSLLVSIVGGWWDAFAVVLFPIGAAVIPTLQVRNFWIIFLNTVISL